MISLVKCCLNCFLSWLVVGAMVVEDPAVTLSVFTMGVFKFGNQVEDRFILNVLKNCADFDVLPSFSASEIFMVFKNMQGWGLGEVSESRHHKRANGTLSELMSHRVNTCSSRVTSYDEKEVVLQVALAVWPWNALAAKNLLYHYEWHGFNGAMQGLYSDALALTHDGGLQFQHIFIAPPVLYSLQQAGDIHLQMLQKAYLFLLTAGRSEANPHHEIRELQQNIEYVGFSIGVVLDLYSACLRHQFAPLFDQSALNVVPLLSAATRLSTSPARPARPTSSSVLRIGVVSEHSNNGAPDLCLADVFKHMQLTCDPLRPCSHSLDLVFFDRPHLRSEFSEVMRRRSAEVIMLREHDVPASARAIVSAHLDVLLYIALPTEKYTVLLSQFRLAKTQIVFGAIYVISLASRGK